MKYIVRLNVFKKDYKRMLRQGKDIEKLIRVIKLLAEGKNLDYKYRDHIPVGKFKSRHECHVEPDWLLIYGIDENNLILERTGSHSELFD